MSTNTTRLGLTKPSGSASPAEAVDIGVINTNMNLIDQWIGCILVNDGVTPATGSLFDGAIVKEKTSGIIWEARKNGGGTFDKVYIRYPYVFSAYYAGMPLSRGSNVWPNFTDSGIDTINSALCKNSSAADISGTGWKAPIKGIYQLHLRTAWVASAAGGRGMCLRINGTNQITAPQNNTTVEVPPAPGTADTVISLDFPYLLNANDIITSGVYQSTGGALNQNQSFIQVSLIEPVQ